MYWSYRFTPHMYFYLPINLKCRSRLVEISALTNISDLFPNSTRSSKNIALSLMRHVGQASNGLPVFLGNVHRYPCSGGYDPLWSQGLGERWSAAVSIGFRYFKSAISGSFPLPLSHLSPLLLADFFRPIQAAKQVQWCYQKKCQTKIGLKKVTTHWIWKSSNAEMIFSMTTTSNPH